MFCLVCNGRLYKDEDVYTCRSCGRHAYPIGYIKEQRALDTDKQRARTHNIPGRLRMYDKFL